METTVPAFEAGRSFGRLLDRVLIQGEQVVIERHGEPVAALVPVAVYRQWQRDRRLFFDQMRESAAHANLPEQEANRLAAEAVRAARES